MTPRTELIRAVNALATGPEDMRGRLPRVYTLLRSIRRVDLPEALRADFDWVMQRLTAREARHNGPAVWETAAHASVAAMRPATAMKVARVIVGLSERLRTIVANE